MSVQTVIDPTPGLVEEAKKVLPGGSFGNMPAEVILVEDTSGKGHFSKAISGQMRHSIFVPIE